MRKLLAQSGVNPDRLLHEQPSDVPDLRLVDGCVFLAEEYLRAKGAHLEQFPDRTGFECFVNHVHFHVGSSKRALEQLFDYVAGLRRSLIALGHGRFEIIISVEGGAAVVRFHTCRPDESWLSADLDKYDLEGILTETVDAEANAA
jgi:hypothetical protein